MLSGVLIMPLIFWKVASGSSLFTSGIRICLHRQCDRHVLHVGASSIPQLGHQLLRIEQKVHSVARRKDAALNVLCGYGNLLQVAVVRDNGHHRRLVRVVRASKSNLGMRRGDEGFAVDGSARFRRHGVSRIEIGQGLGCRRQNGRRMKNTDGP